VRRQALCVWRDAVVAATEHPFVLTYCTWFAECEGWRLMGYLEPLGWCKALADLANASLLLLAVQSRLPLVWSLDPDKCNRGPVPVRRTCQPRSYQGYRKVRSCVAVDVPTVLQVPPLGINPHIYVRSSALYSPHAEHSRSDSPEPYHRFQ